jgi:dTDP-4-dehydrorhamnose reductase
MKIAIIGAQGQLGCDVHKAFDSAGDNVFPLSHTEVEITNIDSVAKCLKAIRPALIVNTAAFTNVPLCETCKDEAFLINAEGAKNVACIARDIRARLFHISTDYVFDGKGKRPYVESDKTGPISVYGATKLAGENFIKAVAERYCILRVSGIYGKHPCRGKSGDNFVEMMLRYAREKDEVRVVDDEILTPTATVEIARQIVVLKETEDFGIFHATAEGHCSWYEFAREIFRVMNIKTQLSKADPGEFSSVVKRPKYSVLENKRLKDAQRNIFRHWKDGISEYLKERA